ncbi:MAG TPA: SprB repeat-containing protein, partial [Cryomorphaceae bacterium]|nr:SprB repeat-containing protein [Cryomorphaceae bacterium]
MKPHSSHQFLKPFLNYFSTVVLFTFLGLSSTIASPLTENSETLKADLSCSNVTDGGQISGGGISCGPFENTLIENESLPSGGDGDLEYLWLFNYDDVPLNDGNNGWVPISNSNSPDYDPGDVSETIYYLRCSRRSGCSVYLGESNIVSFIVNPAPSVECISSPASEWQAADGSIQASAQGGTPPYSFLWNSGQTTASIYNLPAGVYYATVTDSYGCSATTEYCVIQPPLDQSCVG